MNAVGWVVKQCAYTNTSNAKTLFGKHAQSLYRKLFVVFNEVDGATTHRFENRIKDARTAETMVVNLK